MIIAYFFVLVRALRAMKRMTTGLPQIQRKTQMKGLLTMLRTHMRVTLILKLRALRSTRSS